MRRRPTPSTLFLAFLAGGLGVYVLHTTVNFGGHGLDGLFDDGVYNVLMFGATGAILTRGLLVKAQRTAWLTMGAGVLCWSLGELYFTLFLAGPAASTGQVSPADVLYLAFYPCCYVALVLLVGAHLRELRIGMWLDGLIGGLGAATVGAAVILPPIVSHMHGDTATAAISLAYPIGDLLMLVFTIGAIGMTGWRPGRVWLLIAAAMLASAVADSMYLYQTANASFHVGKWFECLWPASAILLAIAAWTPWPKPRRRRVEDWRLVSVPTLSLLAALGVFVYGNLPHEQLTMAAIVLATVTVLTVGIHLMMTVRENLAMLVGSREMALTDPLTGLGNRRLLIEDLHVACRLAQAGEPWELVLYDLNGFKRYNDTFGHPAGDALLARLSGKLSEVVAPYGTAYRMGGDEFCVLFRRALVDTQATIAASLNALSEQGPGFAIDAAHGVVSIPREVSDPPAIMQLADQRLYKRKDFSRESSAVTQLRDVLLQAFQERYPDLQEHQRGVGTLVLAVGRRLEMSAEDLDVLARAAELHDVGKIAIPDAILNKPGPLDEEEWKFMRRHTILGERILMAASALRPVARLVRSSHERFDGGGYPDGLAGQEIPLGARIIFVCDAFDAMTSDRAYSAAIDPAQALAELRRCAGTQFDPHVVSAFAATLEQRVSLNAEDLQHGLALGQHN
ncbi:MAG TPA: diguanylate cyclase [Solirubrobacteraceae bacterium]|jgi:diguanylate cyclase (GGDEF)-like protein|nr:diguanylate cyclase [Solirubrobacteraceae bacterium]